MLPIEGEVALPLATELGDSDPLPPSPPPPPPPPPPVDFPLGWLLDKAPPAIWTRALVDVAQLPESEAPRLLSLSYSNPGAIELMLAQGVDGTWNDKLTALPEPKSRKQFAGIGTAPALHRLRELGWDRESPPFVNARRVLFRLLAEDTDPSHLFEYAKRSRDSEAAVAHRRVVRESSTAVLAHAGYEADPRLRGALQRAMERVTEFLSSPLADDPWIKSGGTVALSPEASPPSFSLMLALAFMPHFRVEHHQFIELLMTWVSRPWPKHTAAQHLDDKVLELPDLVLGDPLSAKGADSDVGLSVVWLEIMARLGILKEHAAALQRFERMLDARDRESLWHFGRGQSLQSTHAFVWPFLPLDGNAVEGSGVSPDVTFRLGLIGRIAGRAIDVV